MVSLVQVLKGFALDNSLRAEKLLLATASANQGKAPTKDAQGRLHAPCDGYVFNDSVYKAGEFMSDEFAKKGSSYTAKVKIDVTIKESLLEVWSTVSFGQSWNKEGVVLCYAYISELTEAQRDTVNGLITVSNKRKMMLVSEATEQDLNFGKSWKFNASKYAKALAYCFNALCHEVGRDGIKPDDWGIDSKTGKFTCRFKGQEVCFVYGNEKDYFNS